MTLPSTWTWSQVLSHRPSLSWMLAAQGPHLLANVSGVPLYLKSAPATPLATWCSPGLSPFFRSLLTPSLSLTDALLGPHSLASISGGSPFSWICTRCSCALPLTNTRCEARRRSPGQLVRFLFLLLFCSLTTPFLTWEPPPARPFVTCCPHRVALPLPCCNSLALACVMSPSPPLAICG